MNISVILLPLDFLGPSVQNKLWRKGPDLSKIASPLRGAKARGMVIFKAVHFPCLIWRHSLHFTDEKTGNQVT